MHLLITILWDMMGCSVYILPMTGGQGWAHTDVYTYNSGSSDVMTLCSTCEPARLHRYHWEGFA